MIPVLKILSKNYYVSKDFKGDQIHLDNFGIFERGLKFLSYTRHKERLFIVM